MTKHISITVSDYVFETYLAGEKHNRSELIESLIITGSELKLGEFENQKSKIISLLQDIRNKDEEIRKLKAQLGKVTSERSQAAEERRKKYDKIRDEKEAVRKFKEYKKQVLQDRRNKLASIRSADLLNGDIHDYGGKRQ